MQNSLTRGQLAKTAQVSTDTIRHYEKLGLLSAQRGANGYNLFAPSAIEQLQFIKRAKQVGFSLDETGILLSINAEPDCHTCDEVKALTELKLIEIDEKLAQLIAMKQQLTTINSRCCGGQHSAEKCSILSQLATKEISNE
jgi:MerR family Zn(II)-responsive transcriptional regulator of zntA